MKLRLLRENAEKVTTKIVVPGDWPARTGTTIPGSVLPQATTDSRVWAQSKYTRDVMDSSVQAMQYLVYVPQNYLDNLDRVVNTPRGRMVAIARYDREWVVNVPCRYELVNIVNRPWDPEEEEPLPRKLGLVSREWKDVNWIVSLEHDLADQVMVLTGWISDDIENLSVSPRSVSYYSGQLSDFVRYPISAFV